MGIQQFPAPAQTVLIDSNSNTVKLANATGGITVLNPLQTQLSSFGISTKSVRSASASRVGVVELQTVGTSSIMVVHSITISQNCTANNPPDTERLGVGVFHNSTGTVVDANWLATNFNFDGTTTHTFPNGGVRLPAGHDLWICADRYGTVDIFYNFTVSVQFSEVSV